MNAAAPYSPRERFWLAVLAVASGVVLNGVFLWAALAHPEALVAAMHNPVSAVFIVEALVLVGVIAYLLERWKVTRVHWAWFVVLALVGSLAFALPVALLWRNATSPEATGPSA